jgi:glyoxylase-like metal-dependent hydrolase (beta-lactamase superfamily II)
MVFWGDLIHVLAVQLGRPAAGIVFDSDVGAAAAQRQAALAAAARGGYLVAGAHISFPGAGRVRKAGDSYEWVPVNYAVPSVPLSLPANPAQVMLPGTTSAKEAN